jgi:hypothetical protein
MSRLLNLGAGDLSDRLTILALKILSGREQGIETAHWETERASLQQKIHARTLNAMWFDAYTELAAINAMLWHAEDDLRAWRAKGDPYTLDDLGRIRIIAFRIQSLNDRRAEVVTQINKEAGDGDAKDKG